MKEFDTAQVEQLKTIGDYLCRERQERAISLDEIAVKTYIPLRLLQALELGNVERLPEPVFVQGFIRRYADAIGLDGTALAKTFSPQPSFVVERKAPESERLQMVERSIERPPERRIERSVVEPRLMPREAHDRAGRSNLPLVLLGTAVTLLVGAGLFNAFNRPTVTKTQDSPLAATPSPISAAPQPNLPAKPTVRSPQTSASPLPTSLAQTSASAPKAADGSSSIQVAVNLTDESWLQVIADGKVEFEGTLKKGDQKIWKAQKTLVLQSGNAGAVSVSYNQGEAKVLGALGEVKDATFPPAVTKPALTN